MRSGKGKLRWIYLLYWGLLVVFVFTAPVSASDTIKYGLHQNKPLNFRDDDGLEKGLVIDVFTHIADQEGWDIEYVPCAWKDCLEKLKSSEIDVLSAIGYTVKRHEIYDFTETPLITNWGMVITKGQTKIESILDLEGKVIAVMKRAGHTKALQKLLRKFGVNAQYREVDDFKEVFELVHGGKVDGGVVNRLLASQYAGSYNFLKSSIIFNPIEIRYAFTKKQHLDVLETIDRYLLEMRKNPSSVYHRSLENWFGERSSGFMPGWLKWILFSSLVLIVFFVAISAWLQQQVRNKTAALYKQNKALETESKERQLAEMQLRKSEERYVLAQKAANVGTWDWNISTGAFDWSEQVGRMFGFSQGELGVTYQDFLRCVQPGDQKLVTDAVNAAVNEKKEYDITCRINRLDNVIRWISAKGEVFCDENDIPVRMLGVVLDVTEQTVSLESFRTVMDAVDALVYVADMNNHELLFVNKYGRDAWGDIKGEICWKALQEDQTGPCEFCTNNRLVDLEGIALEPIIWEFQNTVNHEWYECRDQAIRWLDGGLVRMEIATNITSRKEEELNREKLEEKLRQSHKMEAIGTLAGGIAHDFNNLLSAILGYTEIVKRDLTENSSKQNDLDQVLRAGNKAKELVRQILTFSRQAEVQRVLFQPAIIIKEAVKLLRSSIPSTIEIQQDIDSNCGAILADPTQLHQILMNLCTNSFQAMEKKGGVLRINLQEIAKAEISGEDKSHLPVVDNYILLTVEDSGPGIALELQNKIFDPYFTTKETGKGTGMGLAIVHGIVQSYDGHISMKSEPGKGCSFHIFFPVVRDEIPIVKNGVHSNDLTGTERIIFVDDEEVIVRLGKKILERLGYQITAVQSSFEALSIFQNQPDEFDLVVTDQTMPGMTGVDLASRMLEIRPDIPVLLCTGYSATITEEKALSMGIKGFAEKPLTMNELARLVRSVLDQEKGEG